MNKINNYPHNFNLDQWTAYTDIMNFFNSIGGGMFLLTGIAGTGKTYLMAKLVTEFKKKKILVSAPTHKAVRVIRNEAGIDYQNIQFATIHSALGLKEKIDGYGKVTYVVDKTVPNKLQKYNIEYMIVDESSMLNDELFKDLLVHVSSGLKILFLGDPVQIPPINTDNALIFRDDIQQLYNIKECRLHEVIRQAQGHPVINLGHVIRDNTESHKLPIECINVNTPVGSIEFINSDIMILLKQYFNSDEFQENVDYARIIAWTNKAVKEYNALIRRIIFKNHNPQKIMKGERITMTSSVEKDGRTVLQNNDEVEVVSYEIKEEEVHGFDRKLKYYDTMVKYESKFFGDIHHRIHIIHEDSESDFQDILDMIKTAALSYKQGSDEARGFWVMFYEIQDHYARVMYSYAITSHKSQGSSFTNTIVDYNDIMLNSRVVERNRIFYTAITRCKKNLHIIKK